MARAQTPGRTQQERTETTVNALVESARELFAQDGYAATSLDAVVVSAGVTKGALYHHFEGKRELFRAVFQREQERLVAEIAAVSGRKSDPWDRLEAGCKAFLELSLDEGVQRITLLDAPGALGWETVRALESGALALMERGIEQVMEAGYIARRPVGPLAHLLFGAMCEAAMVVARAENPRSAQRAMLGELRTLLRSLRVDSGREIYEVR
jgi:AcrR family transcriptional regulator